MGSKYRVKMLKREDCFDSKQRRAKYNPNEEQVVKLPKAPGVYSLGPEPMLVEIHTQDDLEMDSIFIKDLGY